MKRIIAIIMFVAVLASCAKTVIPESTDVQDSLIGTEVNFEPFLGDYQTRVNEPSNNHAGGFNPGDMLYIYRQYWNPSANDWEYGEPPVTCYKYTAIYNGTTGVFDKSSWKVYEGMHIHFEDPAYTNPADGTHVYDRTLTKDDAIIWENGKTVRFRCWGISTLGNTFRTSGNHTINYPDYWICDWMTVSGPATSIPMSMKHLGCRIGFVPLPNSNSQLQRIQISTDWQDYMREDNADKNADDAADKAPDEATARARAAEVQKVVDMMCCPAGVSMDNKSLVVSNPGGTVTYLPAANELTKDFITAKNPGGSYINIKHAGFTASADTYKYLISVPYDMSNEDTKGDPLVLPKYTRFKVWLRDVNNGDAANTSNEESQYHIFALNDVITSSDPVFDNGLIMRAGVSYQFRVGYHNKQLTVRAADTFNWELQDLESAASNEVIADKTVTPVPYKWWTDAIDAAIDEVMSSGGTKRFEPDFHITTDKEFLEFMELVNGTDYDPVTGRGFKKSGLLKAYRVDSHNKKYVDWYTGIGTNIYGEPDTTWATAADKEGFVFYKKYFASVADRAAYSEEFYLTSGYNFYDSSVERGFKVSLDNDIDLHDWELSPIGFRAGTEDDSRSFAGYFNGKGHLLKNVYVSNGDGLFGYLRYATVNNLRIEATYPFSMSNICYNSRILGCSVKAPSYFATLASKAEGRSCFVGCIHEGEALNHKPLVAEASANCTMYGCLQAARGLDGSGALISLANGVPFDNYASQGENTALSEIKWTSFGCNYFDIELSPDSKAVASYVGATYATPYNRIQYIRGTITHVLCARNDFLIDVKTEWKDLVGSNEQRKIEYYGVAPWRAMNYAIKRYNDSQTSDNNKCLMRYDMGSLLYNHSYPSLISGAPATDEQMCDVTDKFN